MYLQIFLNNQKLNINFGGEFVMAEQIERQLTILSFLEWEKNGLTEDDIISRLFTIGIIASKSTIKRDLDHISLARIPIYEEKRDGKKIYKLRKYKMDNLLFSFEEVIGIHLLKGMISPLTHDEIWKKANKIIDLIISKIPKNYTEFVINSNNTKVITNYKYLQEVDIKYLKLFNDAINKKKSIEIKYSKYTKKITIRTIDPYKIIFEKGMYYLIAYCHLRNEIRQFRLNRILDVKITKNHFKEIKFNFDSYIKNKFIKLYGNENNEYKVKIRFKGDKAKYLKEYDIKRASKVEFEGDDLIFYRTVHELNDIKRWILGYGSDVEVLEPLELRTEILDEISSLYNQYKK
jgi:proteasome accessory factor B